MNSILSSGAEFMPSRNSPAHRLSVRTSRAPADPEWDAFLACIPGGHHVQTSLWGRVKLSLGWRVARVILYDGDAIVGGVQLLVRPLPLGGSVGYVPKGPVIASADTQSADLLIAHLHRLARTSGVRYLIVQPPNDGVALAERLPGMGFGRSIIEVAPSATTIVDLSQDEHTILARMRSRTRYNVRLGQRRGVVVREGTEDDLGSFHRLLVATGERKNFGVPSLEYFECMWRLFAPHGFIKLFLSECEGELVSGLLLVPFGHTVIYKRGAWSGRYGNRCPNEAAHWTAMRWAKSMGYRYYDFEGIDPRAARAVQTGGTRRVLSDPRGDIPLTRFKLGFGGEVALYPQAYDYVYNPFLRRARTLVDPRVVDWRVVAKLQVVVSGLGGN